MQHKKTKKMENKEEKDRKTNKIYKTRRRQMKGPQRDDV